MRKRNLGFTLAEVLITLVIIGVVAAMTIPTVMQNTQKQEYITALKKAHSVLAQANARLALESGYAHGDYSFYRELNYNTEKELKKVLNVMQSYDNINDCWDYSTYKRLNNSTPGSPFTGPAVITADGMFWSFQPKFPANNLPVYGLTNEDKDNLCLRVMVDVNGARKPNKFGIDVFFFYVIDGKGVVPAGSVNDSDCTRSDGGWSCAAKVLREGKINY